MLTSGQPVLAVCCLVQLLTVTTTKMVLNVLFVAGQVKEKLLRMFIRDDNIFFKHCDESVCTS